MRSNPIRTIIRPGSTDVLGVYAHATYSAQSADFVHLTVTSTGEIIRRTLAVSLADGTIRPVSELRPIVAGRIKPAPLNPEGIEAMSDRLTSWMIARRWVPEIPAKFVGLVIPDRFVNLAANDRKGKAA